MPSTSRIAARRRDQLRDRRDPELSQLGFFASPSAPPARSTLPAGERCGFLGCPEGRLHDVAGARRRVGVVTVGPVPSSLASRSMSRSSRRSRRRGSFSTRIVRSPPGPSPSLQRSFDRQHALALRDRRVEDPAGKAIGTVPFSTSSGTAPSSDPRTARSCLRWRARAAPSPRTEIDISPDVFSLLQDCDARGRASLAPPSVLNRDLAVDVPDVRRRPPRGFCRAADPRCPRAQRCQRDAIRPRRPSSRGATSSPCQIGRLGAVDERGHRGAVRERGVGAHVPMASPSSVASSGRHPVRILGLRRLDAHADVASTVLMFTIASRSNREHRSPALRCAPRGATLFLPAARGALADPLEGELRDPQADLQQGAIADDAARDIPWAIGMSSDRLTNTSFFWLASRSRSRDRA